MESKEVRPPFYAVEMNECVAFRDSRHHCVGKLRFHEWIDKGIRNELVKAICEQINDGDKAKMCRGVGAV